MHSMTYTPEQIAQLPYEAAKTALEGLVGNLERGQLSLADSLTAYTTAQQLTVRIAACLAEAEHLSSTLAPSAS